MRRLAFISKIFLLVAIIFGTISPDSLVAQDFNNHNWYFGATSEGINFNKSDNQPNLVNDQNPTFGQGGSAVATDPWSGELLFYTDGVRVYDDSHAMMPGVTGGTLGGNPNANQQVAVAPVPNEPDRFFIIVNVGGAIEYSKVDMTLPGNATAGNPPRGDIIGAERRVATGINSTGPIKVFSSGNPLQYYLVTQNSNSLEFEVYSIGAAAFNLVASAPNPNNVIAENFSYHAPTGKLAVAPSASNRNVQLYDLSGTSFTFDTQVFNSGFSERGVYDLEWSPNGQYLYISREGGSTSSIGQVYQYDLNNPSATLQPVLPADVYRSYGLKAGPDGNIYHLYQSVNGGPIQLGRINEPDSLYTDVAYELTALTNNSFEAFQFPEFLPEMDPPANGIQYEVIDNCQNLTAKFFPTIDDQEQELPSRYFWNIVDPSDPNNSFTSNNHTVVRTFSNPTTLQVGLVAITGRDTLTYQDVVNIAPLSSQINLGNDTVYCPEEFPVTLEFDQSQIQEQVISIRWSTGASGNSIQVDSAGFYWVAVDVRTQSGETCTMYDGIQIDEYGAEVQLANKWYFGNQAGLDFNQQPPAPLNDGQTQAPEGVATISDENGEWLLYTDGNTIWGRNRSTGAHDVIGTDIGGDNDATQSAIIIPFPEDETMYYVFTAEQVLGDFWANMNYSVVDIKKGESGELVVVDKHLFAQSTERMTALETGGGYVLLAHEYGTNTFRAYPIDSTGINAPVLSSIGSVHDENTQIAGEGQMKFSPDGSKVAVALSDGSNNYVELFDFDSTLTLTNYVQIDLSQYASPGQEVYGVEFSSGGSKLFVTLKGSTSTLLEFRVDSAAAARGEIPDTGVEIATGQEEWGSLQIAPTGQILMARNGAGYLGAVNASEDTAQVSTFQLDGQDLGGGISTLGLPNFIQSIFRSQGQPGISVTGAGCRGTEIAFSATPTSIIDEFSWTVTNINTGNIIHTSAEQEFNFVFDSVGTYDVTLQMFNRCGLDTTLFETVTIEADPAAPTIPPSIAICDQNGLVLDADTTNTPGLTFVWNTGDSTDVITVTDEGLYSVTVTNAAGCTNQGDVVVGDARPNIDLGPDQTVCQNEPISDLDANIGAGAQIAWFLNGSATGNTNQFQAVNTSNAGQQEYVLQVTDPINGCVALDTTTFTVNAAPSIDTAQYLTVQDATCGGNDGVLDVSSAPNIQNLSITWLQNNNLINNGPAIAGLSAGTYVMEVVDPLTSCATDYTIGLNTATPPQFTVNPIPACGDAGTFEITVVPTAAPYQLIITDASGNQTAPISDPDTDIVSGNLAPGDYTIEIQDGNDCVNTENATLDQLPEAPINVTVVSQCALDAELVVDSPNNTQPVYLWRQGTTQLSTATIFNPAPNFSGDVELIVQDNSGNLCTNDTTFTVEVFEEPLVNIVENGDQCSGQVTLAAEVQNPVQGTTYSYQWFDGQQLQSRPLTANPNRPVFNVEVTVLDQQSGCTGTAGPLQVEVYPPIDVEIISSLACENEPVTLTATNNTSGLRFQWFGPGGTVLSDTTESIEVDREGTFRVEATRAVCTAEDDFLVRRNPITPSGLNDRYLFCSQDPDPENQAVILEPTNTFINYVWEGINTGILINGPQAVITEEDSYEARLTNSFGCVTIDTVEVIDDCIPRVFAPNAISPNGQPENREFYVRSLYVQDFQVFIYNRWGELIFYSENKDFRWDGTYNGQLLPIGTYPYLMRYRSVTDPQRGVLEKRGGVALIR